MAIVQCEHGHYYDDSRDTSCPYCQKLAQPMTEEDAFEERVTQYKPAEDEDDGAVFTENYGENVGEAEMTIGIFDRDGWNALTAGWLVCTEGKERGASYPIYSGRNFVGRDDMMDIALRGDNKIRRQKHFSLVFDPRRCRFYAVEGEGILYLNGEPLLGFKEIFEDDRLQAGDSTYLFVPFCKGERKWL